MAQFDTNLLERTDAKIDQTGSRMYKLVLRNDESTPMDAVTLALMLVFDKSQEEATSLMLSAHINGQATIAVMPKKMARAKQAQAVKLVHSLGFTEFTITLEEA